MPPRPFARGRFQKIRTVVFAVLSALAIFHSFSVQQAYGASINVSLTPEVTAKFPQLRKVLNQLLETLNTPGLWGSNLNLKVPDTGLFSFGKYTIREINSDFVKYLTDGKLRIDFKLDDSKKAAADTFCHTVFTANDITISLHSGAGSWRGKTAPYSDYDLAITIYHELLHVWQFHHEAMPSCYILTKEIPSYFLEKYLPKDLFDTRTCPDPLGSTPVFCRVPTGYPAQIDMVLHFPRDKIPTGDHQVVWAYIGQCTPDGDERTCSGSYSRYGYPYASYAGRLANGQSMLGNLQWRKVVDGKTRVGPGGSWFLDVMPTLPRSVGLSFGCSPDRNAFPNEIVSGNKVRGWCNFGDTTFDARW